jgi:hypothetical protein
MAKKQLKNDKSSGAVIINMQEHFEREENLRVIRESVDSIRGIK